MCNLCDDENVEREAEAVKVGGGRWKPAGEDDPHTHTNQRIDAPSTKQNKTKQKRNGQDSSSSSSSGGMCSSELSMQTEPCSR
jgi:hypothetical protein